MKRLRLKARSGKRSGIGLMMMCLGAIQMTAAGYAHGRGEFHQAAIFNSPRQPGLTVEPCQTRAPILQRPAVQAIQQTIHGNAFDAYGDNHLLIIGLILYVLAFLLRKWSGNVATGPMWELSRRAKLPASKIFDVKDNSRADPGGIGSMRRSLAQDLQSLQARFLTIKDAVEATRRRIRAGIEATGHPTRNSAEIYRVLEDIDKAANGMVAITQEGIESMTHGADSVTRQHVMIGAVDGAAMAASGIIAAKLRRLERINSATVAMETGALSRCVLVRNCLREPRGQENNAIANEPNFGEKETTCMLHSSQQQLVNSLPPTAKFDHGPGVIPE